MHSSATKVLALLCCTQGSPQHPKIVFVLGLLLGWCWWDVGDGMQDVGCWTSNVGCRMLNVVFEVWDVGHGMLNTGCVVWDMEYGT